MPVEPTARISSGIVAKSSGEAGLARSHHGVEAARGDGLGQRFGDVVFDQGEAGMVGEVGDVGATARGEVVDGR